MVVRDCDDIDFHQWLAQLCAPQDHEMMQIVLDGSARGGYMSYAGIYGSQSAYQALHHTWSIMLERHKLTELHTTDAMRFAEEFEAKKLEWGSQAVEKRDVLLADFASLRKLLDLKSLGFSIHGDGLSEKETASRKRELFQNVVTRLLERVGAEAGDIHLVCDTEQDAADSFRQWLDNLRLREPSARRIAVLCFASSKAVRAIQLADMVAYFIRDECERQEKYPSSPVNPILNLLMDESARDSGLMRNGKEVAQS